MKLEKRRVVLVPRKEPSALRKVWLFLTFRSYVPIDQLRAKQGSIPGLMNADIDKFELEGE